MNKETRLLAVLDDVFGLENKIDSQFRKVSQSFDEQTNEHVFLIEYRFRGKGELKTTPRKRADQPLIRQINARAGQNSRHSPCPQDPTRLAPGQRTIGQNSAPRAPVNR